MPKRTLKYMDTPIVKFGPNWKNLCNKKPLTHVDCPTNNFDFAEALGQIYLVLELIVSYLSNDDLLNVSSINDAWKVCALQELSRRKHDAGWFGFIKSITKDDQESQFSLKMCSIFSNLNIETAVIFVTRYHDFHILEQTDRVKYKVNEILKSFLGLNMQYRIYKPQQIDEGNTCFCGILFPKIPNVTIEQVYSEDNLISLDCDSDYDMRCLLIFTNNFSKTVIREDIFNYSIMSGRERIAIAGGILLDVTDNDLKPTQKKRRRSSFTSYIKISSKRYKNNFAAYSRVFEEDVVTDEAFVKFKSEVSLKKFGIALLFKCVAIRAESAEILKLNFPNYYCVCVHVDGEIGWNSNVSNLESLCLEYTQVLAVLTWD